MLRPRLLKIWMCLLLAVLAGSHLFSTLHSSQPRGLREMVQQDPAAGVCSIDPAASCCADDCHCADAGAVANSEAKVCPCGDRLPDEPLAPVPQVERLVLPLCDWVAGCARPCIEVPLRSNCSAPAMSRPIGLLPSISRQKALSVWHC